MYRQITVSELRWLGIPQLIPERFYGEHNVLVEDEKNPSVMFLQMTSLTDGWEFIGWTYAEQESCGGRPFSFLCMFQKDDTKVWCHIPEPEFLKVAARLLVRKMIKEQFTT